MELETLYKRTKTGAIQYWNIVATDSLDGYSYITKESGQLGTKSPIIHNEHIREGKNIGKSNETTHLQQAELQAKSDWTRKHDEGYKSLKDLGIIAIGSNNYQFGEDFYGTMELCLDKALPQFNSDASGNVKPMLATDWKKIKKIDYPVLVQPKLDGVRCLMIVSVTDKEGGTSSVRYLSRSGKEYTTLNHITTSCTFPIGDYILDGEIYSDELTFQEIIAAVKKQRPDSLKLKFRAYDVVTDSTQENRWSETVKLVDAIASPHVWTVITTIADSKELVTSLHNQYVEQGYEGAMIRLLNGTYAQSQRSSHLLKVKEFDENEFAFKNFEFGQRGVEDLIAVLWNTDGDKEFRAKVIGTKKEKEELYEEYKDNSGEGKSFTIKHFGFTDENLPRFPIGKGFRHE